jgi:hypothetical protein
LRVLFADAILQVEGLEDISPGQAQRRPGLVSPILSHPERVQELGQFAAA